MLNLYSSDPNFRHYDEFYERSRFLRVKKIKHKFNVFSYSFFFNYTYNFKLDAFKLRVKKK